MQLEVNWGEDYFSTSKKVGLEVNIYIFMFRGLGLLACSGSELIF